ncbi:MAG TPA: FAD-dependent oxidoreductase [Myxococcales bacterium]|nr:FAD-dependent oxidoreductase [Myxococcales bacterium]
MTLREAFRSHWPEYAMEAAGLGVFMLAACVVTVALEHPASRAQAIDPRFRRGLMGAAMGLTAIALIYSPWGKRSGAHLNPSVTLAFWRLGRVPGHDAIFYAMAQAIGGIAGVGLAWATLRESIAHPATNFAVTLPAAGIPAALAAEFAISFVLITVVLMVSGSRFARFTGLCAGALVATCIFLVAPISGMSMNPARSLASALGAGSFASLWIYFVAPPLGMLAAALVQRRRAGCAKLDHAAGVRCIFCDQRAAKAAVRPKRIVILGGGFGAVFTAQQLERRLAGRGDYEIVLIAKDNHFVFQPMLPEVISGTIGLLDLVSPLRRLLPGTEIHVREVESIDLAARTITTAPGFLPHPHVIEYDHLVLALGTVTDFRGLRGLPEHALPFKNLNDALHLRNHVIRALEEAAIERHDGRLRRQLLTFVVAGGGFSGVEVVAELNDFVRSVAKNYPQIDPREIRVVLVHSQDRILPEVSRKLGEFAQRILRKRGVELLLNARLSAATGEEAVLGDGKTIPTRTLVSTVPSFAHTLIEALPVPKNKGSRVRVTPELQVEGLGNVWALGDCAQVPAKDGTNAPPTAQHATRQAAVLAHNLVASIRGGRRRTFDFKGLGKMGSLGRHTAVAEVFGMQISGRLAWFLWRTIYLTKLPGIGRRLKVAASWTFDLFLPPELVQFRFGGQRLLLREYFEPGQEVFRQGDLGDRIYAILEGEVEVVVRDQVVARLGPGELFGEMALLDHTVRNATIRCASPLSVWSLPRKELELLAEGMPELRRDLELLRERRARPEVSAGPRA